MFLIDGCCCRCCCLAAAWLLPGCPGRLVGLALLELGLVLVELGLHLGLVLHLLCGMAPWLAANLPATSLPVAGQSGCHRYLGCPLVWQAAHLPNSLTGRRQPASRPLNPYMGPYHAPIPLCPASYAEITPLQPHTQHPCMPPHMHPYTSLPLWMRPPYPPKAPPHTHGWPPCWPWTRT